MFELNLIYAASDHSMLGDMLQRAGGVTLDEAAEKADAALRSCSAQAHERVVAIAQAIANAATATPAAAAPQALDLMLSQVEEVRTLSESCDFRVLGACAELFFDYLVLGGPQVMARREVLWVFAQSLLLFATDFHNDDITTTAILGDLRGFLRRLLDGDA